MPTVYEINVCDRCVTVSAIASSFLLSSDGEGLLGRHYSAKETLRAVFCGPGDDLASVVQAARVRLAQGHMVGGVRIVGYATTSAADAVLWASELTEVTRDLSIPHAIVKAAIPVEPPMLGTITAGDHSTIARP